MFFAKKSNKNIRRAVRTACVFENDSGVAGYEWESKAGKSELQKVRDEGNEGVRDG